MASNRDISCDRATVDDLRTRAHDSARVHRLVAEVRALADENDKLRAACKMANAEMLGLGIGSSASPAMQAMWEVLSQEK